MFPLRDTIPSRTFPVVTVLLICLNMFIFFYELSLGSQLDGLFLSYGVVPVEYSNIFSKTPGQIFGLIIPLFSSLFLHGGWFHAIGNMWYLWIFGDNVEDRLGHLRYLFFYLLCGWASGLSHLFLNWHSQVPTIGVR